MYLWLILFSAFCPILASLALVALRVQDTRTQSRMERALKEIRADDPVVTTHVKLDTAVKPKRSLDRIWWNQPARRVLVFLVVGAFAGSLVGWALRGSLGAAFIPIAAALGGSLPVLYYRRQAAKRLHLFEEQLPDALDFLARSVRTGHALSVSLEMLAPETMEPLRSEFVRVGREQALGASLERALREMMKRVPLLELRFFVAAVLVQKEMGGNLADVLNKLSTSLRERMRIKAQVRASSAQGRLTARVLSLLPLLVVLAMNVIAPAYFKVMTGESAGRIMLLAALLSQLVGYVCMRMIVDIEV